MSHYANARSRASNRAQTLVTAATTSFVAPAELRAALAAQSARPELALAIRTNRTKAVDTASSAFVTTQPQKNH